MYWTFDVSKILWSLLGVRFLAGSLNNAITWLYGSSHASQYIYSIMYSWGSMKAHTHTHSTGKKKQYCWCWCIVIKIAFAFALTREAWNPKTNLYSSSLRCSDDKLFRRMREKINFFYWHKHVKREREWQKCAFVIWVNTALDYG